MKKLLISGLGGSFFPYLHNQLESKFDYTTKIDGGYLNKGTFILFYDTDLTIQKAP